MDETLYEYNYVIFRISRLNTCSLHLLLSSERLIAKLGDVLNISKSEKLGQQVHAQRWIYTEFTHSINLVRGILIKKKMV